jgi:hypothetical protein
MPDLISIAETKPAGGAALGQVALMFAFVTVAWGSLLAMGYLHRRGRRTPLGFGAELASRVSGLPVYAALPLAIGLISMAGVYAAFLWDSSLHIDSGRDTGPFANPSHYFMLLGLYGLFAAGFTAMVLAPRGADRPPSAVRLSRDWHVPVGALVVTVAASFAFLGFPLDDVWHRIYGQDVTLWGPTHLIMLGAAVLSLVGFALLVEDAARARRAPGRSDFQAPGWLPRRIAELEAPPWLAALLARAARVTIAGALLVGVSALAAEFDFGVPQFQLTFQPLVIAFAAGVALVAARIWAGPGAAIGAVAVYLAARAAVAALVGPVLGETAPAMPLFVVEALGVELLAVWLGTRRPLALGALAGLLAGTAGFASEWVWVDAVMPIPWTEALLPEGLIVAVLAGLAGGVLGGLLGASLRGRLPHRRLAVPAALAAGLVVCGLVANGLVVKQPQDVRAAVSLEDVPGAQQREVLATVRFDPPDVAEGATWVRAIAWQGGGRIGFELERLAPGVYRTPEPLPVHGEWKAGIRVANGRTMLALPLFAPADPGIPAGEVPAPAQFTRALAPEHELLQRERDDGTPGWMWTAGSLTVLALFLPFFAFLGWGVGRFASRPGSPRDLGRPRPGRGAVPASTPAGART